MSESKGSRMLRVRLETIERLDAVGERWWMAEGAGQMSRDWEWDEISYSEIIGRLLDHYEATRARRARAARRAAARARGGKRAGVYVPVGYAMGEDGLWRKDGAQPAARREEVQNA